MENKLTRDQVKTILQGAPKGTDPAKIVDGLVARGYILEGFNEPKTAIDNAKDFAVGFGKGVARTAVNTASGLQDIGQGILGGAEALVTGKDLSQTRAMQPNVGIDALKQETPEGQAVTQALAPTNDMQKYGGMAETGAEVLAGGGAQLLKAGAVRGAELIAGSKLIPAVKTGTTAVKTALTPDSAAIMQRVARIPKGKQIKFEETAGEPVGDYLVKRGIYGDEEQIVEKLYKRFNDSKNVADEALASLEGTYQPQQVKDALEMLAEKFTKASTKGAKDPNLARTEELIAKLDGEGLSMTEINEAKRLFEKNVKLDFARENSPDGLRLSNNVDEAIRQWQFNQAEQLGLKNLPEINRETRLARQLMDDLGAESAGIAGNNAVSLTDWIVLAEGNPASIAAFLGKKTAANKKIQSAVAKKFAPKATVGQPEAVFKTPKNTTPPQPQKVSQQSSLYNTPKTVSQLVDNATKYNPEFIKNVDTVAKELGFDVAHGPVKKATRLQEKIDLEGESIPTLRDTNRSTILVKSSNDLQKVVDSVKSKFDVTRVKDKFSPNYDYKSAIINVRTPAGHEAEIAVTTPKMWEAKKTIGDKLYNVVRVKASGWEDAEKQMKELYRKAN